MNIRRQKQHSTVPSAFQGYESCVLWTRAMSVAGVQYFADFSREGRGLEGLV
jgi:hypothetical protein